MRPQLPVFVLGLGLLVTPAIGSAGAAEAVRLIEWEGPAVLISGGGPARELFELQASMSWPRGLAGQFAARFTLPDGRVESQAFRVPDGETPRQVTIDVPASSVRNLRPPAVLVRLSVVDTSTNGELSNTLTATIDDFPRPQVEAAEAETGPFGWGTPLSGPAGQGRPLPRSGPDGLRFVRIPATGDRPGFAIATTEASNAQVARRLPGYDPRAGRSDEFALEDPAQPAVGLTPEQAQQYLSALGKADPSGLVYQLPTVPQWQEAARAGRTSPFWWGDEPSHPAGANFLGTEPGLPNDSTAGGTAGFEPNPWHLFHTFGNVAEWATAPGGAFEPMGGHFRTEPANPLPEVKVTDPKTVGPDPYVGVRPTFVLDGAAGEALALKALRVDKRLAGIRVAFDPDRSTATLSGSLPDSSLRRVADRRLGPLWFLAAVENRIETPTIAPGQLARLGAVAGPVRRITPLGHWFYEVPLEVRWSEPLPVSGSDWWVNVFLPNGGHLSHRLVGARPDRSRKLTVLIERARMAAAGLPVDSPVTVGLSLGSEASNPFDPQVVSNVVPLRWSLK